MPVQATVLRGLIVADGQSERQTVQDVVDGVSRSALRTKNLVIRAESDVACVPECDLIIGVLSGNQASFPLELEGGPPSLLFVHTSAEHASGAVGQVYTSLADLEARLTDALNQYVSDMAVLLAAPRERRSGSGSTMAVVKQVVDSIADGSAGWAFRVADERRKHYWVKNTLQTVLEVYSPRAKDAYVVWLKPVVDRERLTVYEYQNLPLVHDHYEFRLGEGLAGKVWQTGDPAVHSRSHPHEWWIKRKEGEDITYMCVPVGTPGGPEGVLAVGSYVGFELQPGDAAVLSTFAALVKLGACL